MANLLTGEEFMKILQQYYCQKRINDILTKIILQSKKESGQLRELLEITDCRQLVVLGKRYPPRYFEAAFDFRWSRASKIIKPGQSPEDDRLGIGAIAAEEMTKDEFLKMLEDRTVENLIKEANNIINPDKNES